MSNAEKAERLKKEFDELFPGGLNARQFWWLVKFAKTVRKFARSNGAFNNLCNMTFRGKAVFKEVDKFDSVRNMAYKGLQITVKSADGTDVMYSDKETEEGGDE